MVVVDQEFILTIIYLEDATIDQDWSRELSSLDRWKRYDFRKNPNGT
jgi:hypothetical protein